MIYSHSGDKKLFVNLFIPSTLSWGDVTISQQTAFPYEEGTTISVTPAKGKKKFAMMVRIPEWTEKENITCLVNGKETKAKQENGYIIVERTWEKGDRLHVTLPMHLSAVGLPDGSNNFSFLYGPIVLASRMGTQRQDGMFADDSRGGHIANGPRLPLQDMPVIIGDKDELLKHLKKDDKQLTFKLTGVTPARYEGMTLEPFFRIHESRYMVYWPVMTEEEWNVESEKRAERERAVQALDNRTADKVVCGEQQPESDHFVEMSKANAGDDEGTHWRETRDWFSYRMKTGGQATAVRIVFRHDANRDARVLVDGVEAGLFGTEAEGIVEIPIPESSRSAETIVVKVATATKPLTPHVYEVRVVKSHSSLH